MRRDLNTLRSAILRPRAQWLAAARKQASCLRAVPWGLPAALLFVALGSLRAAPAQTPDYAAEVGQVFQAGLTAVGQAKYVLVETAGGRWGDFGLPERAPRMSGNAWLLETRTNGEAVVLVEHATVAELVPTRLAEQRKKALRARVKPGQAAAAAEEAALGPNAEPSVRRIGDWTPADLKADLRSLLAHLNQPGAEDDWEFKRCAPRFFLFAAQVYRRGQTTEANRIISLLFDRGGGSRKVLNAALSQLADAQYKSVYAEFQQSGDWVRYRSAMEGLVGRFAPAWHNAPVVERLAALVRKQLEQGTAPAVTGEGLNAEDTALAALLGQSNTVASLRHPVFGGISWLVNEPAAGARTANPPTSGPLELIQERGARAVPLLTTLLTDPWLVRVRTVRPVQDFVFDLNTGPLSREEVGRRLILFARPWSRGEIARRILEPVVLGRDDPRRGANQVSLEELTRKSRAWSEQHQIGNQPELWRQLLAEGYREALSPVLNGRTEADRLAVESYLLNTNQLAENLAPVTLHARRRGTAAIPFVQKYLAEVKQRPSLLSPRERASLDARTLKWREEQTRSFLQVLEELVADRTAEPMLQELTGSERKWDQRRQDETAALLATKLAKEDPDQALTLLLRACLRTRDDALAEFLLRSASPLRNAPLRNPAAVGAPPPEPRAFKLDTHAALWRQLLAQERTPSALRVSGEDAPPFRSQVASIIEGFYGDPRTLPAGEGLPAVRVLGAKAHEITLQRALARLAGKPEAELPPYPDPTRVSPERVAQIGRLLRDSSPKQQHETAGRLSADELMAVPGLLAADRALNEKLRPESHRIRTVRMTCTNQALVRLSQRLKDRVLDRKGLESVLTDCVKLAGQGSNVIVTLERRLPLAGLTLTVGPDSAPDGAARVASARPRAGSPARLSAMLRVEGSEGGRACVRSQGFTHWPIESGATPAREEEEFWKSVEALFAPGGDACQPYSCTLAVQQTNSAEKE